MQTQFISLGTLQLETASWMPPPGAVSPALSDEAIVLLHEGLGSLTQWRQFPQSLALSLGLPVFAYARAGYGQSSPRQQPYGLRFMHQEAQLMAQLAPHIVAQFAQLALHERGPRKPVQRLRLVGHSDGASIALLAAAMMQSGRLNGVPINGVAVMAPHLFVEPKTLAAIAQANKHFSATSSDPQGLRARLARHHHSPEHTFRGWADIWLHDDFPHWNIEQEVALITCPLLAIQGEADEYGTMRQIERIAELRRTQPGQVALLKLPGARHSPHLDQPEAVIGAIAAWVQSTTGESGSGVGTDPNSL